MYGQWFWYNMVLLDKDSSNTKYFKDYFMFYFSIKQIEIFAFQWFYLHAFICMYWLEEYTSVRVLWSYILIRTRFFFFFQIVGSDYIQNKCWHMSTIRHDFVTTPVLFNSFFSPWIHNTGENRDSNPKHLILCIYACTCIKRNILFAQPVTAALTIHHLVCDFTGATGRGRTAGVSAAGSRRVGQSAGHVHDAGRRGCERRQGRCWVPGRGCWE